jgi:hypothetical protein
MPGNLSAIARLLTVPIFLIWEDFMNLVRTIALCALTSLLAGAAQAAPAELLNKSITVSYAVTIPGVKADGSQVVGSRAATRTIYISSAGRAFARVNRRDGKDTQTKEAGPGDSANTVRFAGNKLVGVMKFPSGAAQMTVSFDPGGQSCSATIVMGREGGHALRWKGVDGAMREATGQATVSNVSCSISSGNAFGGQ